MSKFSHAVELRYNSKLLFSKLREENLPPVATRSFQSREPNVKLDLALVIIQQNWIRTVLEMTRSPANVVKPISVQSTCLLLWRINVWLGYIPKCRVFILLVILCVPCYSCAKSEKYLIKITVVFSAYV